MKLQGDKEAIAFINVLVDKVLAGPPLTHQEVVPLAMCLQSIKPLEDPKKTDENKDARD